MSETGTETVDKATTSVPIGTTIEVNDTRLSDIFTTAIEGGINYWAEVREYKWDVMPVTTFHAQIVELDDGATPLTIDITTITKGLSLYAERYGLGLLQGVVDEDDGDFDAGDADVIVQLGLFGEVVYG